MKIFVAGARSIAAVDEFVQNKLSSICQKGFWILVGDCYGVDKAVQQFLAGQNYGGVTVYASNGKARNNVGCWSVKNIPVDKTSKGFAFYRQKDIAMADDADMGFMIWDGQSRGTAENILTLAQQEKTVLVYTPNNQSVAIVHSLSEARKLVNNTSESCAHNDVVTSSYRTEQLSMI